jgi:hypothetical protein
MLHHLIDSLPESELELVERLLERLQDREDASLPETLRAAPWDDEPETAEERSAIAESYEALARGEVYTLEEVLRILPRGRAYRN